ncbi:type VII secretion protein EssA [Lactococcus nasutitermitis]|uniref:Type VII secretion protein EssA n=1 Tax=Lactococcus nasutitermitis TaxID=1652957 RepID=A0ABV9JC51_9LACT|nr:type VII secretion protein EssA [Lactococcus nasutitermitis]
MKKTHIILLALCCSFIFLISIKSKADDNGSLQLNSNVVTNSNGGVGTGSEFPIRNALFTTAMNQKVKAQMQDKIPEQQKALNFSKQTVNSLYNTDTSKITKALFVDYKPQVIASSTNENNTQKTLWYWLLLIIAIPLVFLAVFLGRKNAKRSLRKKR